MSRVVKRMVLSAAAVVAVATVVFALVFRAAVTRPAGDSSSPAVRVEVPAGEPFSTVVDRLARRGVIARPWALKILASARGYDRRIRSGVYVFDAGERPLDILARLVSGDVLTVDVTVPEGYTTWEIARVFEAAGIDSAAMIAAFEDPAVLARRRIPSHSLEGYLFPDTYRVRWGASPAEATAMMVSRLDEVFDSALIQRTVELGMTPHEVLTLASIVEAETRVPAERALVSAVYHERLRRGMRLEADPTVAYAMGGHKGRLLYADLQIDSPYNTYRHSGLPPGPICSPGEASIRAALYPDSTSRALYFVARGDGSHIFSSTLAEHNAAVRRVRRERRAAPRP